MILDFRLALRSLCRNKRFALSALVAFSFGIGATATVFSVVDAVLLQPATFPHPDSVVAIQFSEKNEPWDNVTPLAFHQIQSRADLFSEVAGSRVSLFTVTDIPVPDQVFGLSVSGQYFKMLGVQPLLGRLLLPEDDKPGASPVVLLSYRCWQQLFTGDPRILGKTAEIDGNLYTVIGVMPSDFVPPGTNTAGALWTTLRLTPSELASPDERNLQVCARLRRPVTLGRAQAALNVLASSLQASFGPGRTPIRLRAVKWQETADPNQKLILWLAMGMTIGLLLIGCCNLSSILLARGIGKRRDYAIRLATGASRVHLICQSLCEVFLLALAAFVLACLGTAAGLHLIRDHLSAVHAGIPNLARIQLNTHSLLFGFGIACLSALLCGLFPILSATSINLSTGLRETGTKVSGSRPVRRFLHSVVAVQAGISMLLLLTSGLLVRSLMRLMSDDHGLRSDHVLTMRLPMGSWQSNKQSPGDQQRRIQQYLNLLHRAQTTHGVQAAALASSLPLSHTVVRTRFDVPHEAVSAAETSTIMPIGQAVTRDYFRVMGIPVLSGRTFDARDSTTELQVGIINQAFLQKYFNGRDPVGQFLYDPDSKHGIQVIGVVKNSPHLDFAERVEPEIYLNFEQGLLTPFLTGLVVRTLDNPQSLGNALRSALPLSNANQAVVHVQTLQNLIRENTWQPRFSAWLFSVFASIALCLSGIGIYGVVSYVTASRQRDYGIRLALGASSVGLLRITGIQGLAPVMAGACAGALSSYWTSQWIGSLLYNTSPFDPVTVLVTVVTLLLVAIAATAGPALHAVRIDPAITLRDE